jgi:hypothetical protein
VLRTAATTVRLPLLRQLCGVWTMTESNTGNPSALLSCVVVAPPTRLTSTVNDDIDVLDGILALKP